jgi:S1-C subfamily serine protease
MRRERARAPGALDASRTALHLHRFRPASTIRAMQRDRHHRRLCGPRTHRVLACVAVALLAGCAAFERQAMRANEHAKAGSLDTWKDARIGGVGAQEYLAARTALFFGGADEFVVTEARGVRTGHLRLHGVPARNASGAAAFAVDERGYWLTAAHAADDAELLVVTLDGAAVDARPAQLVWSGAEAGVDLALVRTDGGVRATIPWAAGLPEPGRVLCCGSGLGSERFCAGKITGIGGSTETATFTSITHDAPLSSGDSGGPAIADDGTLVGVNVETAARPFGRGESDSTALLPAESFIRAAIERDVAQRAPRGAR